jgi:Ca-activated chloride channel family protein
METEIDEEVLQGIASLTGGRYFRATDNEKLQSIYAEIDQMERTKLNVRQYNRRSELFEPFALAALVVLVLELLMRMFVLKRLP